MQVVNLLDLIILFILLFFIVNGYRRGLVEQISIIFAVILSLYIALKYYTFFKNLLNTKYFSLSREILDFVSFTIIFIFINLIIFLFRENFEYIPHFPFFVHFNKYFGAFLGLAKGLIIIYLFLLITEKIPYQSVQSYLKTSFLAENLLELSPLIQYNLENKFK